MRILITIALFTVFGCSDTEENFSSLDTSSPSILEVDYSLLEDVQIIDIVIPDAYIDPCTRVTSSQDIFCECKPECCQTQMWYCPPSGLGITAAEVTMNICDDDFSICDRSIDLSCPPNEVLSRSSCNTVLECPPGIDNRITITVQCEIEGVRGEQEILCTKGDITYGECVICEPEEERCNYQDDDCDGITDENQRNVCDSCGPIPAEVCDNIDNDCNGETDEDLIRECNTLCERGFEVCQAGNWISCTAKRPVEEACDGADNDCDGRIDEGLECLCNEEDVGALIPCAEDPLLCGQGFKTCECANDDCLEYVMTPCAALCNYIPTPGRPCDINVGMIVHQEECNNFDEDCDQLIDENLTQECYTGDPELLFTGVCTPGNAICRQGAWGNELNGTFQIGVCLDEVLPSREICDGADNDCDGEVDYGDSIRDTDILFIVDWSGSMDEEIEAVRISLSRFAQQFAAEEVLQWGLIIGPKEAIARNVESVVRVIDISPFDQFLAAFAALGNEGMDTGMEMLKDAIYFSIRNITANRSIDIAAAEWHPQVVANPPKERFSISWRNNAQRIVVVFSDERPQSFLVPAITNDKLVDALRGTIDLKLYAFVAEDRDGDAWIDIILAGRGNRFLLTSNAVEMYNNLMSIIDDACLPPQNEDQAMMCLPLNKELLLHSSPRFMPAKLNTSR